ncbi:nitric oxide reductase activation protein NorD [Mycobacterium seoulense]|uniref:nitric oxide reductase activation protein NorD n=1 Tax=Mycobacterium seoulense TaxID=386911 RepID=UPI003CF84F8A
MPDGDAAHVDGTNVARFITDIGRYSLLASAIAGRRLALRAAAAGTLPYTDAQSIFIPTDCPLSEVVNVVVLHASILGAGTCHPDVVRRLRGKPRPTRRYFALEARRATKELAWLLPCMSKPGAGVEQTLSCSAVESLEIALSRRTVAELPTSLGELRPKALLRQLEKQTPLGAPNTLRSGAPNFQESDADDDEDAERSRFLELMSSPLGGNGRLARLFAALSGASRKSATAGGGANDDSPTKSVYGRRWGGGGIRVPMRLPNASSTTGEVSDGGTRYPEWDVNRRRYRENYCVVRELDPVGEIDRVVGAAQLRYPLGRSNLDLRRCRHESEGEEFDLDAVVTARADARAGQTPDDRLFTSIRRVGRDLGVLILIDASGSTGERSANGRTACEAQVHAAARIARTLELRGDRVAIYGFNSRGRASVYLYPIKLFEKPLDSRWRTNIARLSPAGFTRMGAAIRHASSILVKHSGTSRKLLVVLSDGFPYDDGYEAIYAMGDTRRALDEARRSRIGSVCLSLGSQSGDSELQKVFGSSGFGRAESVEALGTDLNRLFNYAIVTAERSADRSKSNKYARAPRRRATLTQLQEEQV